MSLYIVVWKQSVRDLQIQFQEDRKWQYADMHILKSAEHLEAIFTNSLCGK
jgi:hypothetical protein